MLGLLLLYFIGKYYYDLAVEYNKAKWLYVILGIVAFYVGTFLGGGVLGLVSVVFDAPQLLEAGDFLLGLLALPFGIGVCWIFYAVLKKNWSKTKNDEAVDIIDGDMMQ